MLYMETFTINIPQMLAYIPYMDPMGYDNYDISTAQDPTIVFSCAVRFSLFPRYEKGSKRMDQFAKSIKEPK